MECNYKRCARSALKICITYLFHDKLAFRIWIETVSISQHNPYADHKASLLPDGCTKPLNFAAVLLKGLLSGVENKNITEVRFQARGARENFGSLRTICDRT